MNICLKTYAKQSGSIRVAIKLQERLPERISTPCELICDFNVVSYGDYYLLTLDSTGSLTIKCQRCLHVFEDDYCNQSKIAVCASDTMAESLMETFECIVAVDNLVDLVDILTDELHLFSPEKHHHFTDCDIGISRLIGGKDEFLPTTLGLQAKTR